MMPQRLLRIAVTENLRNVRFLARELKGSVAQGSPAGVRLPQPAARVTEAIADFSDSSLTALETIALKVMSSHPLARTGRVPAFGLDHYLGGKQPDKDDEFARNHYAAAKQVLVTKGAANPNISEAAIGRAYRRVAAEPDSRAAIGDGDEGFCRLAAALTERLRAAQPVSWPLTLADNKTGAAADANLYVALVLGLALAVASVNRDLGPDDDLFGSAAAAVDIRYGALANAAASADPRAALAAIFAGLAPHLP